MKEDDEHLISSFKFAKYDIGNNHNPGFCLSYVSKKIVCIVGIG